MNLTTEKEQLSVFGLSYLLKTVLACIILFPAYSRLSNNSYYIRLVLPNIVIVFLLGWYLLFCLKPRTAIPVQEKESNRFLFLFISILLLYNIVCYFMNGLHNQWYWDQINYTIGFLFLLFLIFGLSQNQAEQFRLFRFFILVTVISLLCSYFLFGYGLQSLNICWDYFSRITQDYGGYSDIRNSWLYPHKSQYSLILLMTIFVVIRQRSRFSRKWMFFIVSAMLLTALYLCNTMAAFGGLALGCAGWFFDYLYQKGFRLNRYVIIGICIFAAAAALLLSWINSVRDLTTLGDRTYIWSSGIQAILENPLGVGLRFGSVPISGSNGWTTDNCHNVFLNHALRYSIPAGILFTLLILLIMAYTIWVSRSFFAVGTWLGIMIILNMDYSLIPVQFPHFILLIYLIYIYKPPAEQTAGGVSPAS